jgi:hypothetical protein
MVMRSMGGTAPALRGGASSGGTAPALRGGASSGGTAPALRGGAALLGLALCMAAASACGDDAPGDDDADAATAGVGAAGGAGTDAGNAAGTGGDDGPSADCEAGTIPSFADVAIFAKCLGCHSTEVTGDARNEAPPDVNFDDYASAVGMAERAAQYVFHGIMPPVTTDITVTDPEKEQLYLWALCGTPP